MRKLIAPFRYLLLDLTDDLADAGMKRVCIQRCIHAADRQSVFAAGGQCCLQVDFACGIFEFVILVVGFITLHTVVDLREVEVDQRIPVGLGKVDILLRHGFDVQIIQPLPNRVDNIVLLSLSLVWCENIR